MFIKLILLSVLIGYVAAGPLALGLCSAGCAAVAVACYSAAGAIFGTVAAVAAPPAILACNSAFGTCMASCTVALAMPTP
jgi:hypothetical protein